MVRGQSLIGIDGISAEQIQLILDTAEVLKALHKARCASLHFNYPTTLPFALLFEKPSLRTRTSFEAGMAHLEGSTIYLSNT